MPYESQLNARQVTFQWVRDGIVRRLGRGALAVLDETQAADLAECMTSAYHRCLEKCPWPELQVPATVACSSGLVTWAAVQGADLATVAFWTADPDVPDSEALPIDLRRYDSTGLLLNTQLTSVFAIFTPRAPVFDSTPVDGTTTYPLTTVRFDPVSGHCYEAMEDNADGSALSDAAQWRPLPILFSLTDPVKLLTLADLLGNGQQERAQAADLRGQAVELLNDLVAREVRAAAQRQSQPRQTPYRP